MKTLGLLILGLLLVPPAATGPTQGKLAATPDMPRPRAAHSATRLPDGRVLLAGGCYADGCEEGISDDAVLFDKANSRFVAAGRLQQARVNHRAIALTDGSVLLIGGWTNTGATASVERYDPTDGAFKPHGRLLQGRDAHTATPLRDGNILITGGYDSGMNRLATAEIYDPRTRASKAVGKMASPRKSHTATLLPDGRVLIAGGSDTRTSVTASLELYDPATRSFRAAGKMLKSRQKHAAIVMGDEVLLLGGAGIPETAGHFTGTERWSIGSGKVTAGPSMTEGRYKFLDSVVALPGGAILVSGSGRNAEILGRGGNRFLAVDGSFGGKLAFATATPLGDGSVLVAGGYDQEIRVSRNAWIYKPQPRRQGG